MGKCNRRMQKCEPPHGRYRFQNVEPSDQESDPAATPKARKRKKRAGSTSQKKIDANRENAKRSTGPKTERGKKNSRGNAIKHGILTKEALLTDEKEEFLVVLAALRLEHMPASLTQELLVEMLAMRFIRQGRIYACQVGVTSNTFLENVIPIWRQYPDPSPEQICELHPPSSDLLPLTPKLELLARYERHNFQMLLRILGEASGSSNR